MRSKYLQDAFIRSGIIGVPTSREHARGPSGAEPMFRRAAASSGLKENWVAGYPDLVRYLLSAVGEGTASVASTRGDGRRPRRLLAWHSDLSSEQDQSRLPFCGHFGCSAKAAVSGFIDQIVTRHPAEPLKRPSELHVIYRNPPRFHAGEVGKPQEPEVIKDART